MRWRRGGVPFIEITCPTRIPRTVPPASSDKAMGVVCGFGADSYRYAMDAALLRVSAT